MKPAADTVDAPISPPGAGFQPPADARGHDPSDGGNELTVLHGLGGDDMHQRRPRRR